MMLTNIHAVEVRFVRPGDMRYATVGDWQFDDGTLKITVANPIGTPRTSVLLIAIHELVEAILCDAEGISDTTVDQWDEHYAGDDPGGDPAAPYHREHLVAETVERMVAFALDVDWTAHDAVVEQMAAKVTKALKDTP